VFNAAEMAKAEADFQAAYGKFMQRWARLEQGMFYLFSWISEMPEDRARAIFYSAKNFLGRRDMLAGALLHAKVESRYVEFIRAGSKKARKFSEFRNAVAHGEVVFDPRPHSETYKQCILVEGKLGTYDSTDTAITLGRLEIASENVRELAKLMFDVLQHSGLQDCPERDATSPEKSLLRVQALPTRADYQ
jgi:hypothetical protein